MIKTYTPTAKQREAQTMLAGPAFHNMLFGGGRSGKTFLICRTIAIRAMKAPESRHSIFRFRFAHVKNSIVLDTWPKMMRICFPDVHCHISKSDWYGQFDNGSEVWFGGLDDQERTDKILGMEFATGYLNEVSQIPKSSRDTLLTRIAQKVDMVIDGENFGQLPLKMYYDENPPSKAHWTYRLFKKKIDPDTKQPLPDPDNYVSLLMNPEDNKENLADEYLNILKSLPARKKNRFLYGLFSDDTENALFSDANFETWRVVNATDLPDMVRVVVAVDPSGGADTDSAGSDEVGIVVAGLGMDGNGYILADYSVTAGPSTWGKVAVDAFHRHEADLIVGEKNFGGGMVEFVIKTAAIGERIPYKAITASRGKAVRAEPVSSLYEQGKVRHVGNLHKLEDELTGFTTFGYTGENSPNRADAAVWAVSELFGGIVNPKQKKESRRIPTYAPLDNVVGM